MQLHIDHAGPFLGKQFLIVVDAHSKWLEVEMVPSTSSSYTIEKLCRIFVTHGLPKIIVSDNGTCFLLVKNLRNLLNELKLDK